MLVFYPAPLFLARNAVRGLAHIIDVEKGRKFDEFFQYVKVKV
jgi:hypothetical protein